MRTFASQSGNECKQDDSLAQQVEHNTFNVGVLGSNPKRITKRGLRKKSFFFFYTLRILTINRLRYISPSTFCV